MPHTLFALQMADAPRWASVFPDGRLATDIQQPWSELGTVWMHTAHPEWQHLLAEGMAKHTPVVVLSFHPKGSEGNVALASGAKAYAHAWASAPILEQISVVVEHGGLWLDPDLMHRIMTPSPKATGVGITHDLTEREWQVARLVGEGLSNKAIAQQLQITERTVKAHLTNIFEKTQSKDRFQLALRINATPE